MKTFTNQFEVKLNFRYKILIVFIFCFDLLTHGQTIRYVQPTAAGNGSGSSWANASANLQAMIDASTAGDQVWVAAGTYYPTNTTDRSISFTMKEGVKIYGSFAGTETTLIARTDAVIAANPSILSGDIDRDNRLDVDNSYHVIANINTGLTNASILDGFTVAGGYANNNYPNNVGGGMCNIRSKPRIANCLFSQNLASSGGGVYFEGDEYTRGELQMTYCYFFNNISAYGGGIYYIFANPILKNCTFSNNSASEDGGAISASFSNSALGFEFCTFTGNTAKNAGGLYMNSSELKLTSCSFTGNSATELGGGIMNAGLNTLSIINCVFLGNNAGTYGGGLYNGDSDFVVLNCSFSGNSALNSGGAIFTGFILSTRIKNINNSIIWGNSTGVSSLSSIAGLGDEESVGFSIIQGGHVGAGNLDINPRFVSQPPVGLGTTGNLRLQSNSPAINAGDNSAVATLTTDCDNNPRIYNACKVDMGAYEFQGNSTYLPPSDFTTDNGLSFDGSNDYVEISTNDLLNCTNVPLVFSDALTIEYWFKGSNLQSAVRFQNGGNFIVSGWNNAGTSVNKHILSNDGGTTGIAVGSAATDGNWHHIAVTWQKGVTNGFKSYLDGTLVEQKNAANIALPSFSTGLFLGSLGGTSEFMNGSLDEVRVWNIARSQEQIQAGMCSPVSTPQNGLILNYTFNQGTANVNNSGETLLYNSVNRNLYRGVLNNFGLTNSSSNWVSSKVQQVVRYVKQGGTGAGTSWADASGNLQGMIDICGVEQVWVASGTYKPTTGTDRTQSFKMKAGVKIYGGFPATGNPVFGDRNWNLNKTYLSGDLNNNDVITGNGNPLNISNNEENSYSVIINYDNGITVSNSLLDGFIISGGNANGSINNNRGGGMYNYNSSPKVVNTIFAGNYAVSGGAVFNDISYPVFQNIVFLRNKANIGGGVCEAFGSKSIITNSTFFGNSTNIGGAGGGLYVSNVSSSEIHNCIFWGNSTPGVGADIAISPGGATSINHTLLQSSQSQYTTGYTLGAGVLYGVNPLFVEAANNNLALQAQSCAVNAGNNSDVTAGTVTDVLGNPRIYNSGTVDLGAYEFQGEKQAYTLPTLTTNNALMFDGVNDYVSITTSDFVNCNVSSLNFSDAITIEYWFKGTNPQSAVRFQNGQNYIVAGWGSGTFKHILSNDGGVNGIAIGSAATDGNWHHVAMTWQRNTANGFKSYLDGVLVEQRQSSNTALPSFSSGMFLGAFDGTSEFLNGALDEVRVWNVARSQAEIQANMCSLTVPQNGLILNYKFNHGSVNATNATASQLLNSAATSTFLGTLNNFSLSGTSSNWVETNTACTVNFPNISLSGFTKNSFCAGSSFNLTFISTGNFNAGNIFQAILSDSNGDFTAGQVIGTGSTVGSIPCSIPLNVSYGVNYRIKVVSTFPSTGNNNILSSLTVHAKDRTLVSPDNDSSSGNLTIKATDTITATNANSGTVNATYQAGKSVLLLPGFRANNASVFKAEIKACE